MSTRRASAGGAHSQGHRRIHRQWAAWARACLVGRGGDVVQAAGLLLDRVGGRLLLGLRPELVEQSEYRH